MRDRILTVALAAAAVVAATLPWGGGGTATAAEPCDWLAGDLHVHTTYSHDSYGGPEDDNTGHEDAYTLGWGVGDEGALAASRGLDYVAITDHNDIRAQADYDQIRSHGVIPIPSYENSMGGHAQMHGATKLYDNGSNTLADVERVAAELRAAGGAFQINHPSDYEWVTKYRHAFVPDAVEIWNIGVWAYEPPAPGTNDHEYPLKFYDRFLEAGHRVAATAGSDSHWRSTTAAQGVGQPTTWICADDATAQGLVDGIKAGRTTMSHQPPAYGGPFAEVRADGNGDGTFEAMLGDVVAPKSPVQVRVARSAGAILRLVTDAGRREVIVTSDDFSHVFEMPRGATFARAEVFYEDAQESRQQLQSICDALETITTYFGQNEVSYCDVRLAVAALTSPIYFQEPDLDPSTTLTYNGATSGRVGSTTRLSAVLTDSAGAPVGGEAVRFDFRGTSYEATTAVDGTASTSVRLTGPPGTYDVRSIYEGSSIYLPSQDLDPVTVTTPS
ncbi:MAG: CehA/McbA family metallohydrolase [Actinomycetota bacterium]|nr:CehA/McbA family metallohydrolase [Actinomycetota bacterium]